MFFLRDEGKNIRNQTIRLNYGQKFCLNETVYLLDKVQDKLTPLEVEARYNLRSSRPLDPMVRHRRSNLEPVIDQNRGVALTKVSRNGRERSYGYIQNILLSFESCHKGCNNILSSKNRIIKFFNRGVLSLESDHYEKCTQNSGIIMDFISSVPRKSKHILRQFVLHFVLTNLKVVYEL